MSKNDFEDGNRSPQHIAEMSIAASLVTFFLFLLFYMCDVAVE